MKQRPILLTVVLILTAIYGQQRIAMGQAPLPLSSSISGESETWKKLATLHNRISPVYSDPNAKAKVIDDFIASEGPGLYRELLDRIKEGFYARNELRDVAEVMVRIKPSPAEKLIAQIGAENDPNQKAMLVYCLGRFDGPNVISALRKALDDTHPLVHAYRSIESAPWPVHRVSDEAYLALLSKVQKGVPVEAASPTPAVRLPRDDQDRQRRYDDLKAQLSALGY